MFKFDQPIISVCKSRGDMMLCFDWNRNKQREWRNKEQLGLINRCIEFGREPCGSETALTNTNCIAGVCAVVSF